jgi:hypothetical protein
LTSQIVFVNNTLAIKFKKNKNNTSKSEKRKDKIIKLKNR